MFYIFTFVFLLFTSFEAQAALSLKASIDSDSIALDEDVNIKVSVSGNLNTSDPIIPKVQGLNIIKTGRTSQIQIVNGNMSITAQFLYTLIPSEEGDFTIPPFKIFSKGKEYKSNSLKLKVARHGYTARPQTLPHQGNNTRQQQTKPSSNNPRFWITTTVDNKNPYLSQQILYKFKLYTRENITQAAPELPEFNDFWSESVVTDQRGSEVINGQTYATWEKVIALVPLKEGKLTIEKAYLDVVYEVYNQPTRSLNRWDPFFNNSFFNRAFAQTKKAALKSQALEINVKPLPQPYPQNFTGLVGNFGLQAKLSNKKIATDESITLELNLSGSGNVKDAVLPNLTFDNFKTYFDKPVTDMHKSEKGLSGKKTFKVVLVPKKDGTLTIPEFSLSYFNPAKDGYVRATVPAQTIDVTKAKEEKTNTVMTQPRIIDGDKSVSYQDIAPVFESAEDIFKFSTIKIDRFIFVAVVYGLPLIFVCVLLIKKIKNRPGGANKKAKLRDAYHRLLEGLETKGTTDQDLLELIQNYISAAFGVKGQALTAQEIQDLCLKNKVKVKACQGLGRVVQDIETAQYGFDKENVVGRVSKDLQRVIEEIHQIAKSKV